MRKSKLYLDESFYNIDQTTMGYKKSFHEIGKLIAVIWIVFNNICYANEKAENIVVNQILDIVRFASIKGVRPAHKLIEGQLAFNNDSREITLLEKVYNFGGGVADISVWRVGLFQSEKKGFFITLPIDQRSYTSELSSMSYEMSECSGSHVSNGKKVWSISTSLLVTEEWSCGSLGCHYIYGFFENKKEIEPSFKHCSVDYQEAE